MKAETFKDRKKEFLDPARAGMVDKLDDSIERIVVKLEELGIADCTVIVLT